MPRLHRRSLWGTLKERGEKHSTEACVYHNVTLAKIKKSPLHIYVRMFASLSKRNQGKFGFIRTLVLNPHFAVYWLCDVG